MTEERKMQIALLAYKQHLRDEGIRLFPGASRKVAGQAKTLGITYEEAVEFETEIDRELFEEYIDSLRQSPTHKSLVESKKTSAYY